MKTTLLTLALLGMGIAANAQCENIIEFEQDRMTQKGMYQTTTPIKLGHGSTAFEMHLYLTENKKTVIMNYLLTGSKACIDRGSKIVILYADNKPDAMSSQNEFNCEGRATLYADKLFGTLKHLDRMANEDAVAIRVYTYKSYVEAEVDEATAARMREVAQCFKSMMGN